MKNAHHQYGTPRFHNLLIFKFSRVYSILKRNSKGSEKSIHFIDLFGLDGKMVMTNEINNFKNNIAVLNTSELKTGMYIVQMITNSGEIIHTQKLTVNH